MTFKRICSLALALLLLIQIGSPAIQVKAEETDPQTVQLTISAPNVSLLDEYGNEIQEGSYPEGTTFMLTVVADFGYQVSQIYENGIDLLDGTQLAPVTVILKRDTFLDVKTSQLPIAVRRLTSGVSNAADYEFFHSDNIQVSGVSVINVYTGETVELRLNDENNYVGQITANGTYLVSLNEGEYELSFTEDQIDNQVGAATAERLESGWQKTATYTVDMPDEPDIILVNVTAPDGTPAQLQPDENGIYSFVADANGDYTVTVQDAAGNTAQTTVTETQVDSLAPEITATRDSDQWAGKATYTYTASDAGIGVELLKVTKNGSTTTIFFDEEDTYIITLKDNQEVTIEAIDFLGNSATYTIQETKIDNTPPEILEVARTSDTWEKEKASYRFRVEEAGSGIQSVMLTIGEQGPVELTPDADGFYAFDVTTNAAFQLLATDNLGLTCEYLGAETQIDAVAPTAKDPVREASGWATSGKYTIQVADTGSGIASVVAVSREGASVTATDNGDGTFGFTLTENGYYTITVTDHAGNAVEKYLTDSQIDTEMPGITDPIRQEFGWQTSSRYVFTVADNDSGIASVTATIQGQETILEPVEADQYEITLGQNETVIIAARDVAGNVQTVTIQETEIDTQPPVISGLERVEGTWAQESHYRFQVTDGASGVREVVLTVAGEEPVTLTPDQEGYCNFTLAKNTTFSITATDNLAQAASVDGVESFIDRICPNVSDPERSVSGWAQEVTYSFTAEDTDSGIASVKVTDLNGNEIPVEADGGTYRFAVAADGNYTVTVTDATGNETVKQVNETEIDTTAPEITPPERTAQGWQLSVEYTFQVTDGESGVDTVTAIIQGEPHILNPVSGGLYTFVVEQNESITITAKDTVGNEETIVIQESQIDTVKPVLSEIVREESGWATESHYSFQATDAGSGIQSVALKVNDGAPVTLTADPDDYYRFAVGENVTFTVIATDMLGNSISVERDESRIDTTAPVVFPPQRTPEGWTQEAQYTFTAEDAASGIAAVTILSQGSQTVPFTVTGNTYSFTLTGNGTYTICVTDNVGNETEVEVIESQVDTTAPAISQPVRQKDGWQLSVEYTFTITEEQSGVASVIAIIQGEEVLLTPDSGDQYTFTVAHNETVTVTAKDAVGNETVILVEESQIDTVKPVLSAIVRAESGWVTESHYVFQASDAASGIRDVILTLEGEAPITLTEDNDGYYRFSLNRNAKFTVTATDMLGNTISSQQEETRIDTTAPAVTEPQRSPEGWTQEARYTFTAEDPASGIASVIVTSQSGQAVPFTNSGKEYTFSLAENGSYTIRVTDNVGNETTILVTEDHVDTTAPGVATPVRAASGWQLSVEYTFTVSDTQSGVDTVTAIIQGKEVILTPSADGKYVFTVAHNETVTITARDTVGNEKTIQVEESRIDTVKPELSDIIRAESGWATESHYSFQATDAACGIRDVVLVLEGEAPITLTEGADGYYRFSLNKNTKFSVTAMDKLGNSISSQREETRIDTTAPAVSTPQRTPASWTQESRYTFTAEDPASGIASVTVTNQAGQNILFTAAENTYSFKLTENGIYTVCVTDNVGNKTYVDVKETQVDTTDPSVSQPVRGESGWKQSVTYTFTVTDGASGVATVTAIIQGKETILTPTGENHYAITVHRNDTITITATDNAANMTTLQILEDHIDPDKPEIRNVQRVETGWVRETAYTFIVADALSGVKEVRIVRGEEKPVVLTPDAEGVYTFTMTQNIGFRIEVEDIAENVKVYEGSESMTDRVDPDKPFLKRSSDTWAYSVTYSGKATDNLSGIQSVTYRYEDGEEQVLQFQNDGSYSFLVDRNGSYTVTFTDMAGNTSSETFLEDKIDQNAPVISYLFREESTWAQQTYHYFDVEDTASGIAEITVNDGGQLISFESTEDAYRFLIAENGSYTITARDVVGNTSSITVGENRIDTVAPVITKIDLQQSWHPTENTVEITASDESELATVTVMDSEGNPYPVKDNGDGSFQTVADHNGEYTVTVNDTAGNLVSVTYTVWHIDDTVPTKPQLTTSGEEKWVNQNVTVTASSVDTQSGIGAYWYSSTKGAFDEKTWTKLELKENTGYVTFSAEQDTVYYIVAQDQVGRVSEPASIRVAIDKTAPSGHALTYHTGEGSGYLRTVNGSFIYNDRIQFSLKASDTASGVVAYQYQVVTETEKQPWVQIEGDEAGVTQTILLQDLSGKIYFKVRDEAGNWSEAFTCMNGNVPQTFILENTPAAEADRAPAPKLALTTADGKAYTGGWTNQNVTVAVTGSSAISGIEYYQWRKIPANSAEAVSQWTDIRANEKGTFNLTISGDTNGDFEFRAVTYAGNVSQVIKTHVQIQQSLPVPATISPEAATGTNGWYTKLPGYTISVPDVNKFAAPVHHEITWTHDGKDLETLTYGEDKNPVISTDGIWTMQITAIDAAGNRNALPAITFKVDTQVPDSLQVLLNGEEKILTTAKEARESYNKVNISDRTVATDFTIFRNQAVTIQPSAQGGDSGMAAIYYQVQTSGADFDVNGTWTQVTDTLTFKPDQKVCLFFKAVDLAGNTTYFSAQSILLDAKAPVGGENSDKLLLTPTDLNLSKHGYYGGDVTVNVHIEEPAKDNVFSGLQSITYKVYANGKQTQSGKIGMAENSVETAEGRILSWDGQIVISSLLNNSNNVILEVTAVDMAGNVKTTRTAEGQIRIDRTTPTISGKYTGNNPVVVKDGVSYFTGKRTLTVQVEELNFIPGESSILVRDLDTGKAVSYAWTSQGNVHTAVAEITEDGNYVVSANIVDAAGNITNTILFDEGSAAPRAFVLDNTKPVVTVTYNNQQSRDIYFNAPRTMTVTVEERNFNPDLVDIDILFTPAGNGTGAYEIGSWTSKGTTHTAHVTLARDGVYQISGSGMDILGNAAEEVIFRGEAAQNFVIDQTMAGPQFSGVEHNTAYAGEVIPVIEFLDVNPDTYEIRIQQTRLNQIGKDVTDQIMAGAEVKTVTGGTVVTLDVFPMEEAYDGIYTVTASMKDKVGNTSEKSITFSVNRFGSSYVYDEALLETNGKVLHRLEKDLVITEINPTRLEEGSLLIQITKDGTPVAQPIYTEAPAADGSEDPAASGWYEYRYVISRENFTQDGIYTVVVSTKDAAGNVPENTSEEYAIRFSIDTTAPELVSVSGLEEAIVKADSLKVSFEAIDNIGLSSILVYVGDDLAASWRDLDGYLLAESFQIPAGFERHVRIVATDLAGNVLDTDAEGFAPGYAWQDVTVSTNLWLRYYANKPLFYGSLIGAAGLAAAIWWLLVGKKKKKEETE